MKIKYAAVLTVLLGLSIFSQAQAGGPTWTDHKPPFDFRFGNNIDSHQQTMVLPSGELLGFFYVEFTGEYTYEGIPIARHADCNLPESKCTVGWQWRGIMGSAQYAYQSDDHPVFLADRDNIPQPGAYSHFHWLGEPADASGLVAQPSLSYAGYFMELTAKDTFVFVHGNTPPELVVPGIDIATHLNIITP